ncbi:MAG: hypothetical protein ACXWV0_07080 [Flavisolibacter sp.]
MKKFTLFTLAFILGSFTLVQAQIKKGSKLLGGGIGFGMTESGTTPNETEYKYFSINPSIGFVTKDNQAIGFNLFFNRNTTIVSGSPEDDVKTNGYGGGVYLRRYLPLGKSFYLFGEGQANFGYAQTDRYLAVDVHYKQMQYNGGLSFYPGITYVIKNRIHLEAGLNNLINFSYSRTEQVTSTPTTEMRSKTSGFSLSANVSNNSPFNIGFRFVL